MKTQKTTRVRGTSLMEVLMAILLVGAAATVMTASMPTANVSRARANLLNRAMGLAEKEVEAIRGAGYSNCNATQLTAMGLIESGSIAADTYSFTGTDAASLDSVASTLPSGTGTVKIEQVDLDLRRITVRVNWVDRGVNRSFTLATLVANL